VTDPVRRFTLAALGAACVLALLPGVAGAKSKPVWLCKPGLQDNPCETSLKTTQLSPTGQPLGIDKVKAAKHPKVDCFYVYPTVSDQPGPQANLEIDPVLRSIALYEAARFSRDCRVFAPVYRQITLAGFGLSGGSGGATPEMIELAYSDVLNAWRTYLKKYNDGRGVVLIGHSQGTFNLERLAQEEIDPKRKARKKLVSAMLLGGNVTVAEGRDTGGDFQHIRACRSNKQLGCVVAFSTFGGPVPADAAFGRTSEPGLEVLCTNPAALGGGSAPLDTIQPSEPFAPGTIAAAIGALGLPTPAVATPWIEYPGAYSGECSSADDANVLQITGAPGAPQLNAVPPSFGLHLVDGNIALGNLTDLVRKQAKTFVKKRG
jgi:pimeloyl-ACP methyl ester carboxylesterase